jgi:hypothetical protein
MFKVCIRVPKEQRKRAGRQVSMRIFDARAPPLRRSSKEQGKRQMGTEREKETRNPFLYMNLPA